MVYGLAGAALTRYSRPMWEGLDFALQLVGVPIIVVCAIIAVGSAMVHFLGMPGGSGGWGVDDDPAA
jgi:hypothetical protein